VKRSSKTTSLQKHISARFRPVLRKTRKCLHILIRSIASVNWKYELIFASHIIRYFYNEKQNWMHDANLSEEVDVSKRCNWQSWAQHFFYRFPTPIHPVTEFRHRLSYTNLKNQFPILRFRHSRTLFSNTEIKTDFQQRKKDGLINYWIYILKSANTVIVWNYFALDPNKIGPQALYIALMVTSRFKLWWRYETITVAALIVDYLNAAAHSTLYWATHARPEHQLIFLERSNREHQIASYSAKYHY